MRRTLNAISLLIKANYVMNVSVGFLLLFTTKYIAPLTVIPEGWLSLGYVVSF